MLPNEIPSTSVLIWVKTGGTGKVILEHGMHPGFQRRNFWGKGVCYFNDV
jgi:hypothetical protein